jgi:hypothetical protein
LFFKHRLYNNTNDKFNLWQGHEDHIRMVNLLPANRACREEDNDDSVLPNDWLKASYTARLIKVSVRGLGKVFAWAIS